MEAVQNRLSLCSVIEPQLAQNQKEEAVSPGCWGNSQIISSSPQEVTVCQEHSTLLLREQGLEDCLIRGNGDEGELLWRADATAGSCASLPGLLDVCAGATGAA